MKPVPSRVRWISVVGSGVSAAGFGKTRCVPLGHPCSPGSVERALFNRWFRTGLGNSGLGNSGLGTPSQTTAGWSSRGPVLYTAAEADVGTGMHDRDSWTRRESGRDAVRNSEVRGGSDAAVSDSFI